MTFGTESPPAMEYVPDRIEEYLSEREICELEFFFLDLRRTGFVNAHHDHDYWNEIEDREELREEYLLPIKKMYDEAVQLAEEDPEAFVRKWKQVAEDTVNGLAGQQERVYCCVYYKRNPEDEPPPWANRPFWGEQFGEKPYILRKAEGRGNPGFKREVSCKKVVETAERLLGENGADAYHVEQGDYSTDLRDDVSDELDIKQAAAQACFEESSFEMPWASKI
jgi:hypothetical protein